MGRPITGPAALLLLLLYSSSSSCHMAAAEDKRRTYIVHMAKSRMPATFAEHGHWYDASVRSVSDSVEILYSYNTVAHGFSAHLTPAEAAALESRDGVLSVLQEVRYKLHTTRTPEFLGLDKSDDIFPQGNTASDVVVGVLDTGVWPERKSFDDTGFGAVPSWWKGACEEGKDFKGTACNRKLIGARFFSKGYEASAGPINDTRESRSPRDNEGHGTHTATTAAGSAVTDVSLNGFAAGTARGMATRARVAAYKVCWAGGCFSSDILAAMDRAVEDGCQVLSLSLGGGMVDYYKDIVAIGAFNAMEKGVLTSFSAGNAGPFASSLSNVAPWMTTVGAGTIDRDFPAYVVLGNGKNYSGVSLYSGKPLPSSPLPFVYAGNASNASNGNLCMPGTLMPKKVAGKIILCDRGIIARVQKGYVVREAGGAGMVLANTDANGEELVADAHLLPAAGVGQKVGDAVRAYLRSDKSPTATIVFGGTKIGVRPSPVVAAFSSRGPNAVTPEILKPDLIAPGVNILAGWTGVAGPTGLSVDSRRVEFNIISGTSMSCPHVSGLAALLKGAHPDWSPAAVRSALMTTAYSAYPGGDGGLLDVATGKAANPFDYGAGHVDPLRAADPGLVYDLTAEDYIDFLCALNYTSLQIAAVAKRTNYTCDSTRTYAVSELNYPSFAVVFETASGTGGSVATVKHTRTVTNVGGPGTYKSTAVAGGAVKVVVEPVELSFADKGEKRSFTVSFSSPSLPSRWSGFGRLEWSDGKHVVASPMAFTWT
ncbi:subtilisin-like protease SBT1.7 [Phoenix dactylifera]|uniref:Subtilisin-like protease SBT1.7 n=1 Tax=Phoenix dactylifera TaxID=42345 RepID=A0A8B7C6G2_PHODC|nr:subtilisin-like protease SBT1.7 [Phoenix dactylifera]